MKRKKKDKHHPKSTIKSMYSSESSDKEHKEGVHSRTYPPRSIRNLAITRILTKKPSNRTGLDWWQLGEYQVINGLLDKDDAQIILGEQSLLEGTLLAKPHPGCLIDLGWILLDRGSVVHAKKYFLDATKADASSRDAWAFLGITEIATNNREHAINAFQRAVTLLQDAPNESDVRTLNLLKSNIEIPAELKKCTKISKFSIEDICQFSHEDQAKAIRLMIDQALDSELPSEQVKIFRDELCGIEYSGLSSFNSTIDVAIKAIEFADTTHIPHLYMGLAYKKLGKNVLSLDSYRKCIQKNPACEIAITNIADILLENHRPREAYNYLLSFRDSGASITSGNFYTNLGNAIAELGMGIREEIDCREKALNLDQKNPKSILNYAYSLLINGDLIKAKGLIFKHKKKIVSSLGAESTIIHEKLIEVMITITDPFGLLVTHDELLPILGSRDAAVFLVKAWEKRESFKEDSHNPDDTSECYMYPDFINELGIKCGNSELHQYSLKCWQELQQFPGYENASWNIPVSLDAMGLHEEALEALKHCSGTCMRKNTITANVLSKSNPHDALAFYIRALSEDELFLMPIENGFALAKHLNRRDLYGDFLKHLKQADDSAKKTILCSQIKMELGFFDEACCLLESILMRDGNFIDIKQLYLEIKQASPDLTLIGERAGDEIHKKLAFLYLITSQFQKLSILLEKVSQWDIDLDGDWRIIDSTALSLQGRTQEAIESVLGMNDQPPPRLAKSFALLSSNDLDGALAELIPLDEFQEDVDGYSYPLCLPSAFKSSLMSLYYLKNENIEKANEHAQHAICLDPSSCWVTDIYIKVLDESHGLASVSDHLLNLHNNAPGNIKLFRRLIMSLAHESRIVECKEVFKNIEQSCGQSYMDQFDDLFQLIEILSRKQGEIASPLKLPEWASLLNTQGRKYLSEMADIQSSSKAFTNYSLLISRFSEYLLRQYFFMPLANLIEPSECVLWPWAQNASSYLLDRTQRPPSLGDMISLIKTMVHTANQSNDYIRLLRNAAFQLPIKSTQIFSYGFLHKLNRLRNYRNCVMHAEDSSADELEFVRVFIFGGNDLACGEFVSCFLDIR